MEISNLSDAEFKTLVIRMPKEFTGHFNSIKNTQEELKVTLSEIKKTLQGTNSRVKQRIKSMIWNIRKHKTNLQTKKKEKEPKKARLV